jgi:hypothetical protein
VVDLDHRSTSQVRLCGRLKSGSILRAGLSCPAISLGVMFAGSRFEVNSPPPQEERHVINLMEALRQSIAQSEKASSESAEEAKPPKKMAANKQSHGRERKRKSS